MAKRIESKDVFAPNLGRKTATDLQGLLEVVTSLEGGFKDLGQEAEQFAKKADFSNSKGIEKFLKQVEEVNKATKESISLDEQKRKIEKELREALKEEEKLKQQQLKTQQEEIKLTRQQLSEESKRRAEAVKIRKERERQFKNREKERKQSGKILTAYQKESKRLTELRNRYKDLAIQNQANTKEGRKLLREIQRTDKALKKLDESVGQNQRSVGDYKKAVEGLEGSLKALSAVAIVGVLTQIVELLSSSREGSIEFQKVLARITGTLRSLIGSLGNAKNGFVALFDAIITRGQQAFTSFKISLVELQLSFFETINSIDVFGKKIAGDFTKNIDDATARLKELDNELTILNTQNTDLSQGLEEIGNAFDDFGKKTVTVVNAQIELAQVIQDTEIEVLKLERGLTSLRGEQELQLGIAEDDTLSFERRKKAFEELSKISIDVANQEQQITQERLRLQALEIQADLIAGGVLKNRIDNEQNFVDRIQQLLSVRSNALKVSSENDMAFTEAYEANAEARVNATLVERDALEKERKAQSDIQERNLDDLIDGADSQKTINEQIISNERENLEVRRRTLEATRKLLEDSYNAQKDTVADFRKFVINNNKDLSDEEKKRQLEIIENADIDAIVAEQDARIANQRIRDLGLSEIFENRLLEIVRERRIAQQDLKVATEELAIADREANEVKADIIAQEEALRKLENANTEDSQKVLQELEEKRNKQAIENARIRVNTEKEGSKARLDAEKELNDLLLEEQQRKLDEQLEKEEKAEEQRQELLNAGADFLQNIAEQRVEQQLSALDKEFDKSKEQQDRLKGLANQGDEDAVRSLQFQQQQQAEIEREKARVIKRQKQEELGLAVVRAYAENAGEPGALAKVLTETVALRELVANLPTFLEGTEDTGTVASALDNNGGRLTILHNNERVMTKEQNAKVQGLSNEELADIGQKYKQGLFDFTKYQKPIHIQKAPENTTLISEVQGMRNELKNLHKKFPQQSYYFDENEKMMIAISKSQSKIERKHYNTEGIWR